MESKPIYGDDEWRYVETLLPHDLEAIARETGALVRCRNVPSAAALLRMALAYAISDLSLKDVAAWAGSLGIAEMTGPGLFYRIREAEAWLQRILALTLEKELSGAALPGLRMRIVDATVINGPGASGVEWRAHLIVDPLTGRFNSVLLTDCHGGESFRQHPVKAGDLVLGDRMYARARGIHAVRLKEAHVLVRLSPQSIRICDNERQILDLGRKEADIPAVGPVEIEVLVPVPPQSYRNGDTPWKLKNAQAWIPARLIGGRTRNGEAIWLLTTVPGVDLKPETVLVLYRLRWQIELAFKRLKSLLHLDTLPSRQGPTARSWMLARFLAAALAQQLVEPSGALSPWGYEVRPTGLYA